MYRTHSQTIAKIFTVIAYILLVPGLIGTVLSVLTISLAILTIPICGIGIWLLVGYHKHFRCNLGENKIMPLWYGTIIYNSVLLIPQVWSILKSYSIFQLDYVIYQGGVGASIHFALISWQLIAILLAITAIRDEKIVRKIRNHIP